MRICRKSALTTIEYAFLIAIVAAVLIAMSLYIKRALSGKWREVGDTFGYGRQYEVNETVVR
ncbi:MAG: Flp family type IVb pilin [Candidatus Omnitrophota bacterium]